MLALLNNIGPFEIVVIVVVAVLIFGKDLPQAASKVLAASAHSSTRRL